MEKQATYNDIKWLCENSKLPILNNRLDAVFRRTEGEQVDKFLEVLRRYFDIKTREDLTQEEVDFCNEVIRVMENADMRDENSINEMITVSQNRLQELLKK